MYVMNVMHVMYVKYVRYENMFGCDWNFGLWSHALAVKKVNHAATIGLACRRLHRHNDTRTHTHTVQNILPIVWKLTSLILFPTSCDTSFDRKWSKPLFGKISCVAIILGKNAHVVHRPALSMRAWVMRVTPRQQLAWMLSVMQKSALTKIFNAALRHSRTTWLIHSLVAAPFWTLEPLMLPSQCFGISTESYLVTFSASVD